MSNVYACLNLERSAYEAIAGLTLSSANYAEAVAILKKRFGNKQLIISKHMETLLGVEAVGSDQNLRGLRRLYDDVESHMRSLKALGVGSESYGTMLASVLLNKLPPDVRLIIGRKTPDTDPDMGALLLALEVELVARERTFTASQHPPRDRRPQERGGPPRLDPTVDTQSSYGYLEDQLRSFWDLESFGIAGTDKTARRLPQFGDGPRWQVSGVTAVEGHARSAS